MQPTVHIDPDSWLAIESPEFAVRFGRLLTATRRRSKHTMKDVAASSLGAFDTSRLSQLEHGSTTVDESIVEALCLLYSADLGQILPVRLPVAIADGRVTGAGMSIEFSPGDSTSLMVAYLRLIRRMRNQKKAPAIVLRRDDILVIARYLDIDGAVVVERLSTLMNVSAAQRNTMAMLFATGAIVIGLAAGGHVSAGDVAALTDGQSTTAERAPVEAAPPTDLALDDVVVSTAAARVEVAPPVTAPVTVRVTTPVTAPAMVPVTAPTVEITATIAERTPDEKVEHELPATSSTESAVVVEPASVDAIDQAADVVGLSTATRVRVPVAAPPLVAAEGPTPNESGCNPDPSEAVMSVVIPDIAYTCPVYAGGQSMIDSGFVTLVTDAGVNQVLATSPGEPGTLWLAGHRTTHGAAFSEVPDLADGALVTVSSGDATATYRVVGRTYVEVRGGRVIDSSGRATAEATWASIIRNDFSGNLAPRLVLQTCEGENFRWMIYADLVT